VIDAVSKRLARLLPVLTPEILAPVATIPADGTTATLRNLPARSWTSRSSGSRGHDEGADAECRRNRS
jgi:hypothetical protein